MATRIELEQELASLIIDLTHFNNASLATTEHINNILEELKQKHTKLKFWCD